MVTIGKVQQQEFYVNIYMRRLYFDLNVLNIYMHRLYFDLNALNIYQTQQYFKQKLFTGTVHICYLDYTLPTTVYAKVKINQRIRNVTQHNIPLGVVFCVSCSPK